MKTALTCIDDVTLQIIQDLREKTEIELKRFVGHLSVDEIRQRCKCVIRDRVHTYHLDDTPIFQVDYEIKIGQ